MAYLSVNQVSKQFGGRRAPGTLCRGVRDLDFSMEKGEMLALVGSSGCGKTTTLRLIAGLERVDEGSILLDGVEVTKSQPAERKVAMVFQDFALYPHMTVRKNLAFPLRMRGMGREEREKRIERVANLLRISPFLDRKPGEISGGERQRAAVGRVLVQDASLYLFDEPLSNLDGRLRLALRREIKDIHKKLGFTAIFVTHDEQEACFLGDRVAVMAEGKMVWIGLPGEIPRDGDGFFQISSESG